MKKVSMLYMVVFIIVLAFVVPAFAQHPIEDKVRVIERNGKKIIQVDRELFFQIPGYPSDEAMTVVAACRHNGFMANGRGQATPERLKDTTFVANGQWMEVGYAVTGGSFHPAGLSKDPNFRNPKAVPWMELENLPEVDLTPGHESKPTWIKRIDKGPRIDVTDLTPVKEE